MRARAETMGVIAWVAAASLTAIVTFLAFVEATQTQRTIAFVLAVACAIPIAVAARRSRVSAAEIPPRPATEMLERMVADLAKRTLAIAESKRTSDLMIGASSVGMLALDDDLRVKPGYATSLELLLATHEIAGRSLLEVMRPLLTSNALLTTTLFLPQIFDPDVSDAAFVTPRELDEVEFVARAADGTARSRYLRFHFERVRDREEIRDAFVVIEDVTERARLQRDLAQTRVRGIRQSAMLDLALRTTSDRFGAFVETVRTLASELGDALRAQDYALVTSGKTGELRERLDRVMHVAIELEREAEEIDAESFLSLAQSLEEATADAQSATSIDGETFLAIVAYGDRILCDLDELVGLRHRLLRMRPTGNMPRRESGTSVADLVAATHS